jgi:hypothetical protein
MLRPVDRNPLTCSERHDARHVLRSLRQYATGIHTEMEFPGTRAGVLALLDAMLIELGALRDRLRG